MTQTFSYDGISRLTEAVERQTANSSIENWGQHYGYDAFGNRAVVSEAGPDNYIPNSALTPQVSAKTGVALPFANNRWTGATHALSGEITGLNGVTYGYDAEKRLTMVIRPDHYVFDPSLPRGSRGTCAWCGNASGGVGAGGVAGRGGSFDNP